MTPILRDLTSKQSIDRVLIDPDSLFLTNSILILIYSIPNSNLFRTPLGGKEADGSPRAVAPLAACASRKHKRAAHHYIKKIIKWDKNPYNTTHIKTTQLYTHTTLLLLEN